MKIIEKAKYIRSERWSEYDQCPVTCDRTETCNGTVTDNLTELTWLRNTNCNSL